MLATGYVDILVQIAKAGSREHKAHVQDNKFNTWHGRKLSVCLFMLKKRLFSASFDGISFKQGQRSSFDNLPFCTDNGKLLLVCLPFFTVK